MKREALLAWLTRGFLGLALDAPSLAL